MASSRQDDYTGYQVVIATVVALFISITAVVLRTVARRMQHMRFLPEDYLVYVGLLFKIGIDVGGVILLKNGLGRHIETLTPEQLVTFAKTQYTGAFTYPACICFVKCSILVQYRRLLGSHSKYFLIQIHALMILVVAWAAAICLTAAFICQPIWKLWEPQVPGVCFSLTAFYYGLQIPNIVTDLLIIVLPVHEVMKLELSRKMKIGAIAMFLLGMITLIFDIVRLVVLIQLMSAGPDITYTEVPTCIWTTLEPAAAIVAVCIPSVRSLYRNTRSQRLESTAPDETAATKSTAGMRSLRDRVWTSWLKTQSTGNDSVFSRASILHKPGTSWFKSQTRSELRTVDSQDEWDTRMRVESSNLYRPSQDTSVTPPDVPETTRHCSLGPPFREANAVALGPGHPFPPGVAR